MRTYKEKSEMRLEGKERYSINIKNLLVVLLQGSKASPYYFWTMNTLKPWCSLKSKKTLWSKMNSKCFNVEGKI
jgi:hypothetical protein